ncbi:MAG: hypothetical protein ACJA2Z_000544 [Candidatus Paceibacteria bacterium]|jgi:hypothetical protein
MKTIKMLLLLFPVFMTYGQNQEGYYVDVVNAEGSGNSENVLMNGIMNFKDWASADMRASVTLKNSMIDSLHIFGRTDDDITKVSFKISNIKADSDTDVSVNEKADDLLRLKILQGFSREGGAIHLKAKFDKKIWRSDTLYIQKDSLGNFKSYLNSTEPEFEVKNISIELEASYFWFFGLKTKSYRVYNAQDKLISHVIFENDELIDLAKE